MASPQIQIETDLQGIHEIIIRVPRGGRDAGLRLLERVAAGLRLLDLQSRSQPPRLARRPAGGGGK